LFTAEVQAAILNAAITDSLNLVNDTDFERLVGSADTIIDVGEQLEAVLIFEDISNSVYGGEDLNNIFGAGYQLTAHVLLTVASVSPPVAGISTFTFTGGFAGGVAVRLYEDTVQDANFSTQSAATVIANATDTPLVTSLGLTEVGDYWVATGPVDISTIGIAGSAQSAAFNFGLSIVANPGGLEVENEAMTGLFGDQHDVTGFGDAFSPGAAAAGRGWDAGTNTTIAFQGIPEPMSVLVWSGLAGAVIIGCATRRKVSH
jgi:hypothetical protein